MKKYPSKFAFILMLALSVLGFLSAPTITLAQSAPAAGGGGGQANPPAQQNPPAAQTTPATTQSPTATTQTPSGSTAANASNPLATGVKAAASVCAQLSGAAQVGCQTAVSLGAQAAGIPNPTTQLANCGVGDVGCMFINALVGQMIKVLSYITFYMMSMAGYLLGLVGIMFDWLVVVTIFQFGAYFGNSQGLLAAWSVLRDLANIAILFGFLYAGIAMILDLHSFDARKAIPRLIIFAVLLNFSLFASEAIVDLANVISAQLYLQAGQSTFQSCLQNLTQCGITNPGTSGSSSNSEIGIASVLIQDTYVGSAFSPAAGANNAVLGASQLTNDPTSLSTLLAYIGATSLIVILMIVLLVGSIMLITRAIALVVLLVVSPLGFAGMAIPSLEKRAQQWWHSLISNATFAPIFLLLIFIGLKVTDGLRGAIANANNGTSSNFGGNVTLASALAAPNTTLGTLFIIYALVIGFFIAALMFSRSSSAAGAQFATNFVTKTLRQTASSTSKVVTLPGRAVARQGVGWASKKTLSGYNRTMATLQQNGGFGAGLAKGMRLTGADEGMQHVLNKGQDVKMGMRRSYKEEKEFNKKRDESLAHVGHQVDSESKLKENYQKLLSAAKDSPEYAAALVEIQQVLLENSVQQVKEMMENFAKNKNLKGLNKVMAAEMTPDKFAKMLDDEHLDHDLEHDLKAGRYDEYHKLKQNLDSAADEASKKAAFDALRKHLSSWTQQDFETALLKDPSSRDILSVTSPDGKGNHVIRSSEIRKSIANNKSIPKQVRIKIRDAEKGNLLKNAMDAYNNGTGSREAIEKLMQGDNMTKDVADVDEGRLFNSSGDLSEAGKVFVANLDDTKKLKAILDKEDGISKDARIAIANHVKNTPGHPQRDTFDKFLRGNNGNLWGTTIS